MLLDEGMISEHLVMVMAWVWFGSGFQVWVVTLCKRVASNVNG